MIVCVALKIIEPWDRILGQRFYFGWLIIYWCHIEDSWALGQNACPRVLLIDVDYQGAFKITGSWVKMLVKGFQSLILNAVLTVIWSWVKMFCNRFNFRWFDYCCRMPSNTIYLQYVYLSSLIFDILRVQTVILIIMRAMGLVLKR